MASRNDFKLLHSKCIKIFSNVLSTLGLEKNESLNSLSELDKARFGFYYLILQTITDKNEIDELTDMISDTNFNDKFFNIRDSDEGIDAAYFDEDHNQIILFNFKYRNEYNEGKSKI